MLDKNGITITADDMVIVGDPGSSDLWHHSFQGNVVGFHNSFIVVADGEGDYFDVEPEKIEVVVHVYDDPIPLRIPGTEPIEFNNYVRDALRTDLSDEQYEGVKDRCTKETLQLLHAAIGLATEAGELLDQVKKHLFYGRELDFTNLIEEGGDGAWYLALLLGTLKKAGRIPSSDVALTKNIAKLRQRYPEAFTNEAAIERDLDEERRILEE